MFIRRSIEVSRNCAAGIVLMLACASTALCQTTSAQESETASSDTPEEIIVYGKKNIVQLRLQFNRAEDSFFTVFNSLNSTDDFDVECDYVYYLGDRRRHHVCMPRFAKKYEAQRSSAIILANNGFSDNVGSANWVRVRQKNELMWKEMATLVLEHPELREEFTNLEKMKNAYEAERQERRK